MRLATAARDMRTMKRLLEAAEAEARRDGAEHPGPEHLVLAALDLPDGSARRALERAGGDPDDYRAALDRQHAEALRTVGLDPGDSPGPQPLPPGRRPRAMRSTANAQRLFQAATRRCRADGVPLAGAHVLLALTDLEHGTAARALAEMGIDRDELRRAALAELGQPQA